MSGDIRLRSNIMIIEDDDESQRARARASLPGEVAADVLSIPKMTASQLRERSLYAPCVTCHRSLWRIARQGCQYECAAARRAEAFEDSLTMYARARRLLDAHPEEEIVDGDPGRGHVTEIPEWRP